MSEEGKKYTRGKRMKIACGSGRRSVNVVKKKAGDFKKGLSEYQKKNLEKLMARKEGESDLRYYMRIKRYRELTPEEYEVIKNTRSEIAKQRAERVKKNKYLHDMSHMTLTQVNQREYFELKYMNFVLRYAAVKAGIDVDDFRILLFFYDNRPFTKEEFVYICKLNFGPDYKIRLQKFINKGYVKRFYKEYVSIRGVKKVKNTKMFMLKMQVVIKITKFYEKYNELLMLDNNKVTKELMPDDIQTIVNEMEREINQITSGRKKADTIVVTDDNEE